MSMKAFFVFLILQMNLAVQGIFASSLFLQHFLISSQRRGVDERVRFDESGGIPVLDEIYQVVEKATPIVAMQSQDFIYFGAATDERSPLLVEKGSRSLYPVQSKVVIGITGLLGDARVVANTAREIALNYSYVFDCEISGMILASKIGSFLQEATTKNSRPFAVHLFVIDSSPSDDNRCIIEIDAAGSYRAVRAGCAGRGSVHMQQELERRFRSNLTESEAMAVAEEVYQAAASALREPEDRSRDASSSAKQKQRMMHSIFPIPSMR